ncbi:MAG: lipopolysaccharide heptosyltransferase II [Syntrophales bacterium]|nr:lipopolysaccharide heptosyltransferase II [Syntrophales bacterium]
MENSLSTNQPITLKVRGAKKIPLHNVGKILIRATNWIGDVVMNLPAIAAVRKTFPGAKLSVLTRPWVAEIFRICNDIDEIILLDSSGIHAGITGKLKITKELKHKRFDMAILLQNAIEAAIITWLAGIPIRAGYNSDGRGLLLTHAVKRTKAIRRMHQIDYYLEMVKSLGCQSAGRDIHLRPGKDYHLLSERLLNEYGMTDNRPLVGVAPGATYGPAKRWFPERFAAVADRLIDDFSAGVILFGSPGDRESADAVTDRARHTLINLAGKTELKEAIALIVRCNLFITNDSGLMHVAGALAIPTIAIFGSTNPVTTSPVGDNSIVIYRGVPCSPCLKERCPTDFRCMELIGVDDVYEAARTAMGKQW